MARPINADAKATRERIRRAASELFSRSGPGSTTMRQIAGQAKVSLAMLNHYFGSKDDLYKSCVEAMTIELRQLRGTLMAVFAEGRGMDHAIEQAIRQAYAFVRSHRSAVQLLMRTVLDTGELDASHREEVLLPFLEQGAALLAPLLRKSEDDTRLSLLSINYLVIRFALNATDESAAITRQAGACAEQVDERIADYLVGAARALLGVGASAE